MYGLAVMMSISTSTTSKNVDKIVGFYFEEVMLLSAGGPDGSQMVLT